MCESFSTVTKTHSINSGCYVKICVIISRVSFKSWPCDKIHICPKRGLWNEAISNQGDMDDTMFILWAIPFYSPI